MLAALLPQLMASHFQPTADEKLCGKCDEWKPHSAFAASNRHSGGLKLQRWCKECHKAVNRNWYRQQRLREGFGVRANPENFKERIEKKHLNNEAEKVACQFSDRQSMAREAA